MAAANGGVKVDPTDPNVRRLVYNMYRGILGTYNDRANTIVSSLPKSMVREDQGIGKQVESMIRQSSQLSGGSAPSSPQGDVGVVAPPPPPPCPPAPPPPPPLASSLPSVRLASEIGDSRRSCHEPPAAIQNAMMTKDKKPFTYTPGGLDLSEIRSPRMARRITRNANAPDTVVPQPAKTSPLANNNQPLPPSAVAAMQPQIAIPVFPQGGVTPHLHHVTPGGHTTPPSPPSAPQPPPPPPPLQQYTPPAPPPPPPQQSPPASMAVPKLQPQHRQTKSEPQQNTPGSLYVPPIQPQQQQQQPQHQTARAQLGSLYIPPLNPQEQKATVTPTSQSPVLNKAPTPWMSKQSQQQKEVPAWVNREDNVVSSQSSNAASPPGSQTRIIPIQFEVYEPPQQSTPMNTTTNTTQGRTSMNTITGGSSASSPGTRIIPIQIEGASSPQQNKQQPSYQQQQQQQRQSGYQQQYQPPAQQQPQQYQPQQQPQQYQPQQQQQQYQPQQQQQHSPQQRWVNQQPVYVHNKYNTGSQPYTQQPQATTPGSVNHAHNNHTTADGSSPRQLQTQQSWGNSGNTQNNVNGTTSNPVQSRSFRVLQKITDTEGGTDQMDAPYNTQGVPLSQLRKLQLSEDDRAFMNKVKTQVDEENYLHNESDPRYRGASIPSRAFRILQSMTDSAGSDDLEVPRAAAQVQAGQNRLAANRVQQQESQPQPYIPPSEQQVQEPRKYTGGAIPSRSFRMLQAMTAGPDNTAMVTDGRQTPQYVNGGDGMWVPPSYNYPIVLPPPVPPLSTTPQSYYPQFYPPQTPEEHQQFWDHYAQMCAYLAEINAAYGYMGAYPPMYSPSPMVHYASDSDECGYSSTDEMTYYGSIFKRYPPPVLPYRGAYPIENRSVTPQIVITPSSSNSCEYNTSDKDISSDSVNSEECFENGEEYTVTDGSDTEVENDRCASSLALQTIRSVPDIRIFKDSSCSDVQSRYSETDEHESDDEDDDNDNDDDDDDDDTEENSSNSNIPHQLSVIFEESEQSSEADTVKKIKDNQIKVASDGDNSHQSSEVYNDDNDSDDNDESSTATLDNIADTDNGDDDDNDDAVEPEATVIVRLPLKLQFSRSDNNEDVTTVIVGDSEVESSPEIQVESNDQPNFEVKSNEHKGDLIIQEVKKVEEPEVSVTFSFPKKKLSVKEMVQQIESINDNEHTELNHKVEKKHRSESPVDFWKMLGSDDNNSLKTSEDSSSASIDVSPSKMSPYRSFDTFTSESEESRPEESDGGHWEDDSSSTSVQTVKIGKVFSGSENFSADEMAGTADEVDDIQVQSKLLTDNNGDCDNVECDNSDDSSSDSDEDSKSSASSTGTSSSSSSSCDDSKQTEEANTVSTVSTDSNKNDSKLEDDDVFVPEVINNVPKNTNTNNNGVTNNNINSNNSNNNNKSLCIKKKKERQNCDNGQDESEEDDSGVTSDMSRHISETDTDVECGSELRKMSRYQRAATHSRLFKLLQDECNGGAAENDDDCDEHWKSDDMTLRKEQLTLPLKTNSTSDPDSLSSSSGINSPSSPTVSDRLVKELVQSLLQKKKGRVFRKLPLKKLHAAALRILQEDMDPYDTVSSTSDDSSFVHSPVSSIPSSYETITSEANNTANQQSSVSPDIYGGNYYDYCDYYNTWRDPWYYSGIEASLGNDIVPSRAFRLLQEHAQPSGFKGGLIEGLWAKCPRVVSSKNIPKDLRTIQNNKNPQTSSSTET